MEFKKIIDISIPIREGMLIYPNNPEVAFEEVRTKHSWLTKIMMGSHTGTHVDAPRHIFESGAGVDALPLEHFIGPCRVLDVTEATKCVKVSDLESMNIQKGERILVKTKNSLRSFERFYDDYVYLDSDAAAFLAQKEIALFGTDYLSVKQKGSEDNRPHTELLSKGIPIFEGLDLSRVEPGEYFFIGLPLRLVGLDGSPARAVLMRE